MRALEFGPLEKLVAQFGSRRNLDEMPSGEMTRPGAVFKPSEPKKQIVRWDAGKTLSLWKERGPYASPNAPALFRKIEDLTQAPPQTIGRDRLVLKPKNLEELMYYTTDDD